MLYFQLNFLLAFCRFHFFTSISHFFTHYVHFSFKSLSIFLTAVLKSLSLNSNITTTSISIFRLTLLGKIFGGSPPFLPHKCQLLSAELQPLPRKDLWGLHWLPLCGPWSKNTISGQKSYVCSLCVSLLQGSKCLLVCFITSINSSLSHTV